MDIDLGNGRRFKPEFYVDAHVHFHRAVNQNLSGAEFIRDQFASVSLGVPLSFKDEKTGELFPDLDTQTELAVRNARTNHNMLYAVGIDSTGIARDPDWLAKSISRVEFHRTQAGNAGVKIWKNLGMSASDQAGKLVTVNHPNFIAFLKYLAANHIRLYWHYGDPECLWRPLEDEGLKLMKQHHDWCSNHPEDHMYGKKPSFDELSIPFENLLSLKELKEIDLCGAHLFNLGCDLDRLSRTMRVLPNCVLDLAERVVEWIYLVHVGKANLLLSFIEEFQDRILYGTDHFLNHGVPFKTLGERYVRQLETEARFLLTGDLISHPKFNSQVKGLGLSEGCGAKIFGENAKRYLRI